jgi:hypothetical protein
MSIVTRLLQAIFKINDSASTSSGLAAYRLYKIASSNAFYESGFIIDKIDSIVTCDLIDFKDLTSEKQPDEISKTNSFFNDSKFIHLGNLQALSSIRLGYEYSSIQKDIKLIRDDKISQIDSNLLKLFTPEVIAQSSDYKSIIENIFKYYDHFFLKCKAIVYRDNKIHDLYNIIHYLEAISDINLSKDEFFKLYNAFFAVYNYGLSSFDAFNFYMFGEILFDNCVEIEIDQLLDFQELEKYVISAFKKNPNHINEIQKIHDSSKLIGNEFHSFNDLFILIENFIRINAYSKYDSESLESFNKKISDFMILVQKNELRLFCFFTLMNTLRVESSLSYNQLSYCKNEIEKINPQLIPNFKVEQSQ